jgi:aryl-alcohol dehydrogenase-like predicted oxidoreductase
LGAATTSWKGFEFGPFILGTAQLGIAYGIANTTGVPESREALEILGRAYAGGARCYDTAQAYGRSEEVIGEFIAANGVADHLVITKLGGDSFESESALDASARISSQRLNTRIFALLSHSADVLAEPVRTNRLFAHAKTRGLAQFTGVSVYSTAQAFAGLELDNCDIIQIPLNVFDRRPIDSGLMKEARRADKLLLFRSVYLQGLLLMDPATLPDSVRFAEPVLSRWQQFCSNHGVRPQAAALTIAAQLAAGFPLIIGGESPGQVEDNLRILKDARHSSSASALVAASAELAALASEKLLDPSQWNNR